jgi:prevent-host-death family protein
MKTIAASEANRHFSAVLREVAQGEQVVVLARGKPVAKIVPVEGSESAREDARVALLARLGSQSPTGRREWSREELYD